MFFGLKKIPIYSTYKAAAPLSSHIRVLACLKMLNARYPPYLSTQVLALEIPIEFDLDLFVYISWRPVNVTFSNSQSTPDWAHSQMVRNKDTFEFVPVRRGDKIRGINKRAHFRNILHLREYNFLSQCFQMLGYLWRPYLFIFFLLKH